MPKPRAGETQDHFISRCVSEVMHEGEKTQDQALGQCFGMWRQAHPSSKLHKGESGMDDLRLFIPITKVKVDQRLVYGVATAELPDRDGEICDYASTKPLYEKWSGEIEKATDGKSRGNVREMHGTSAAGKLTSIAYDDAARQIEVCAKVVDDAAWNKVIEGVYTGFSQGGRYVKRWRDEPTGMMRYTAEPIEISLVDLPCLSEATFEMIKADGTSEKRHFKAKDELELAKVHPDEEIVVKPSVLRKLFEAFGGTLPFGSLRKGGDAPGEGDKPYGDVEYADPGYQSDGKKRYPVDTEAHIRAAWSYINKPKNAGQYSSDQVARIKRKIVSAWKEKIDSAGPPSESEKLWAAREAGEEAIEAATKAIEALEAEKAEKGMSYGVGQLAQAFDLIRQAQRLFVAEGRVEGDDPGDAEIAAKLGSLAAQLADCIAVSAHHEGNEAHDLSDADDVWVKVAKIVGSKEESIMDAKELEKRRSAIKEACGKAAYHFGKAADCYKSAHGHMTKAASHAVDNLKEAAAGSDKMTMTKAAHTEMLEHIHKAREQMSSGGDHMEIGNHHLGKASGASNVEEEWGGSAPGHVTAPEAGDDYDATRPVFGRGFDPNDLLKAGGVIAELIKAKEEAAAQKARADTLASLPAGPKRASLFSVEKNFAAGQDGGGDEGANKLALLMKGVNVDSGDPDSINAGATTMLTNMFANAGKFARDVMDPSFRGGAGVKRTAN